MFKKKDLYKLKFWGGYSIKKARRVITISKSSRNDIIKEYGLSPEKVEVVYPGIKQVSSIKYQVLSMGSLARKYGVSGDYILFVGTIQPRKNLERLIEAFSMLLKTYDLGPKTKDLQLVIVGRKGWMYDEILNAPKKFDIEDRVKFVHDAIDEDLPLFYQNAVFLVLPSLYEGFGLPILEAMQNGCPVITSNVSSLPEAGGDAALYVDPNNTRDISEKMQILLKDEKIRQDLINKGYEQAKKFSWEKSARETLRVLEEVVRSS
jgi:glycosyltransferase involved in cell wall biosynthesis